MYADPRLEKASALAPLPHTPPNLDPIMYEDHPGESDGSDLQLSNLIAFLQLQLGPTGDSDSCRPPLGFRVPERLNNDISREERWLLWRYIGPKVFTEKSFRRAHRTFSSDGSRRRVPKFLEPKFCLTGRQFC